MNPMAGRKLVFVTPPAALVDDASFATTIIDTQGYRFCNIYFFIGATDIAMTALKVQESDDSGMSGATDIAATIFGTANNDTGSTSTLPSGTDDNKIFEFAIDLKGKKRYLDVVATNGDGTAGGYGGCIAILSNADRTPLTAVQGGVAQRMVA